MSDLGDLIDDMWNDAGDSGPGGGGCMVIGCIIFFVILGIMIYFMK